MDIESHMQVGDLPLFDVSIEVTGLQGLVWTEPRDPDAVTKTSPARRAAASNHISAAIHLAARSPNVFLETSGMPAPSETLEAVGCVGSDRVVYGSDAPFHHPSVELAKVRVSGPSTDPTDRVLGEDGRGLSFGDHAFEVVA